MEAPFSLLKAITVTLLLSLPSSEFGLVKQVSSLGINYGQVADNLPSPELVLRLLRSLRVTKTRIYDTNPKILAAFANSGIEFIVTVPNEAVADLTDQAKATEWIATNIRPFLPDTTITGIAVGNEVFTSDDAVLMETVVPAMWALHQALVSLGLDSFVHVSTSNSLAVLGDSYPPSLGSFRPDLEGFIGPFLGFLANTSGPFWINAYPYFAYKSDPERVPLDYVLFNTGPAGTVDPNTGLRYDNMLYAQVDAVVFAMARYGYGEIEVRVSETGWPSKGDDDEVGATVENAMLYNRNLVARQMENEGTPLRPRPRLEVYMFALFNEDLKPGPTSERNYGLYRPDGTMAYNVGLSASSTSTASLSALNSSAAAAQMRFGKRKCIWYWIIIISLTFPITIRWKIC